jgi:hypothetical protein
MITLAAIVERFEADYLAQYQSAVLPSHRNALAAMKLCRSSMAPRMLAQCTRCDEQRFVPLEFYIGSSGRVSEVLNRKRRLSLQMVKRLHDGLHIPYESLLAAAS